MGLGSRSENCCCCFGVKAGTLILLYLDLFAVILVTIAIFNSGSSVCTYSRTSDAYGNQDYSNCSPSTTKLPTSLLFGVLFLAIIIAGLFAVGKKKPSLLIPYFIVRIVVAIVVAVFLLPLLFFEKKGLDFLDAPKTYNKVYMNVAGDKDNSFGNALNYASYALYGLIIFEILLIVLEIHYAKVIYACYKKIEEELVVASAGITYSPLIPPPAPYYLSQQQQQQLNTQVPPMEPVYAC